MVLTLDRPPPSSLRRTAALRSWYPAPRVATAAVVLSSISLGSATFFVRRLTEAGLAPASMAFYRYAITAVVLARFLALSGQKRRATLWGLAGGAIASLGWIAYAKSIEQVDLATNGVAYMTYPAFTLLTCRTVFKRQTNARSIAAGALVIVAAVVAVGPGAIMDVSPILFIAPATFGFSVAVLTERLHVLDPLERLSAVAIGATITLAPLLVNLPTSAVIPTTISTALWVVAIGVICALVPMLLYGAAAPIIGGAKTAMAGTSELPTMFVIGALVFGEAIRPEHLIAGALIVISITVTPVVRSNIVDPDVDGGRISQLAENGRQRGGVGVLVQRRDLAVVVDAHDDTRRQIDVVPARCGRPDPVLFDDCLLADDASNLLVAMIADDPHQRFDHHHGLGDGHRVAVLHDHRVGCHHLDDGVEVVSHEGVEEAVGEVVQRCSIHGRTVVAALPAAPQWPSSEPLLLPP